MKKVLLVIDGKHFSNGAFEFIKKMNDSEPVLLVGLFLPAVEFTELFYAMGGMTGPVFLPDMKEETEDDLRKNIELFEHLCEKNGIEYRVHNNPVSNIANELKVESRYADLMVIGNELFYSNLGNERQYEYLLHALHNSECPALLVPEQYSFPETLVITYDGSASSTFALKLFSYLFPDMCSLKTLMVYASVEKDIPDTEYVAELASRHYSNLTLHKLTAEPLKYFESWLMDNKNPLVISGAYSRSFISEIMKRSFVSEVINDHNVPVFIAHTKH